MSDTDQKIKDLETKLDQAIQTIDEIRDVQNTVSAMLKTIENKIDQLDD